MKERENKIIFTSDHGQPLRAWISPWPSFCVSLTLFKWRGAQDESAQARGDCTLKTQSIILKSRLNRTAQILCETTARMRSSMSEGFCERAQDCLKSADGRECVRESRQDRSNIGKARFGLIVYEDPAFSSAHP
jgi:hypothetical protein